MSEAADSASGKGASGYPEPGSAHDDSKTETVAQGPDIEPVDGVPGAFGDVETRGGPVTEATISGAAAEIEEETRS